MPNNNAFGVVNPYGAGNVRFDTNPITNYYLRQQAHKQAKDEALDKYFLDMQKNITPAGMRNQEIPILVEKSKQLQQMYLKDRAAIKNPALDNGAARTRYFGHYQDMMGLIQNSKNELAGTATLMKLKNNPNIADRIDEGTLQALDLVNLPIGHPDRKVSANDVLNDVEFEAKRLTPSEVIARQRFYGAAAGKPDVERVVVGVDPNDPLKDRVRYTAKFAPEDLKKIGDVASADFADPSVKRTFSHPTPEQLVQLTEVGKQAYGPDWVADTPEKVYAAASIAHWLADNTQEKSEANKQRANDLAMQQWYAKQARRAADQKKAKEHAAALKKGQGDQWLEGQLKDAEEFANKDPRNRVNISGPNGSEKGIVIGFPAPVLKTLSVNSGGQNVQPDAVLKYNDGSYAPVFYKRNPDFSIMKGADGGNVIDQTIPSPKMSRQQIKAAYGKGFATGANLTGQFDGGDVDVEETPAPAPAQPKFKGLPKAGKF